MATELLEKAFSEAAELPPAAQDWLAQRLLDEVRADHKWDDLLAQHPEVLDQIETEAKAALASVDAMPLDLTNAFPTS
ncbi:MAG: hypothetical protein NTZ56_22825 [Acidobacteria bacterium]|nr:hypothetical protein [Acidobacteriota bacterium]